MPAAVLYCCSTSYKFLLKETMRFLQALTQEHPFNPNSSAPSLGRIIVNPFAFCTCISRLFMARVVSPVVKPQPGHPVYCIYHPKQEYVLSRRNIETK